MAGPFFVIATNKLRDGKLADEMNRVPGWVRFIHDNEPRTIGFHEYRSPDGTEVEYIQIHPDTDSFEHHMRVPAEKSVSPSDAGTYSLLYVPCPSSLTVGV
jgi:hypothetical protein